MGSCGRPVPGLQNESAWTRMGPISKQYQGSTRMDSYGVVSTRTA